MTRKKPNTAWLTRTEHLPTRKSLILRARESEAARFELMMRYRDTVEGYLGYLLSRDSVPPNLEAAKDKAKDLWRAWVWPMVEQHLCGDSIFTGRFRDVLVEWVHKAYYASKKKANVPPGAGDRDKFLDIMARKCLAAAKVTLQAYEQTSSRKNHYATIVEMHEQHPDDDMAQLGERLTTRVGGKWSPNKVTKALGRAYDKLGEFLVDEVLSREMIADRASLWDAIEALNLRYLVDRSSFIRHYCALDGEEPAVLMTARQRFKEWRDERPNESSIYCDVLTIWEESPRDGIEEMVQQVAEKIPGAWDVRRVDEVLGRAFDRLGEFLVDELRSKSGTEDREELWQELERSNLEWIAEKSAWICQYFGFNESTAPS